MIQQYVNFLKEFGPNFSSEKFPEELLLNKDGDLETYYSPFEYVNTEAKIVFCGITPGASQAVIALNTAAKLLSQGEAPDTALRRVKQSASFAGSMRKSLTKMLDHVRLPQILGIDTTMDLFGSKSHLVHYTSALKYPVFYKGGNYNGSPSMLKVPSLMQQIEENLTREVEELSSGTIYVPLGSKVAEVLNHLVNKGFLSAAQVLDGLPHPSGANAERIAYFCGEKKRENLSEKTNPDVIDAGKQKLLRKLSKTYVHSHTTVLDSSPNKCSQEELAIHIDDVRTKTMAKNIIRKNAGKVPAISPTDPIHPTPSVDDSQGIWVPVAKDYTFFGPHLQRTKGFTIGKKAENKHIPKFEDALEQLRKMPKAYWRRPSATSGTPGTVISIGWIKIDKKYLDLLRIG